MYDVVVAADEAFACEVPISLDSAATANLSRFVEATAEAVRKRLRETGQSDRDELCAAHQHLRVFSGLRADLVAILVPSEANEQNLRKPKQVLEL